MHKIDTYLPALRFPEFEGDWSFKKAREVFHSRRERGEEAHPIYSVTLDRGLVPRSSVDVKIQQDAATEDNLIAHPNDIVYNMMRMWQGALGIAYQMCLISPAYVVLQPKQGISSEFYAQLLKTRKYLHQLESYSYGLTSDRLRLYYKDFALIMLPCPSFGEQVKIARFHKLIDDRANLLEQKKLQLERYKKGIIKKIFSQEIRFKKDDGEDYPDWERVKVKDVSQKKSSSLSANGIENNVGVYPIYGASGLLKYISFYEEESDYISIVKDGAGIGRLLFCPGKSSVLGTLDMIKQKPKIDLKFLYYLLHTIKFNKYVTGSTIPHIYYTDYSNEVCYLPTMQEQQKIAAFISAVDTQIRLLDKQIQATIVFKQGLMQRLFV